MQDLDKQIAETEKELGRLRARKQALDDLTPDKRLAELLHRTMCHYNHTDGCGWHYENWTDPRHARKQYLAMAQRLLKVVDEDTATKVVHALNT